MNTRTALPRLGALAATVALMSACSGGMSDDPSTAEGDPPAATEQQASDGGGEEMAMGPAANLVGPGCADYAAMVPDGEGSVEGMAQDPVSVAASNNPMLTTLTSAVSGELNPEVALADTLDGDEIAGTHTTVQGEDLEVTGSGDELMVGEATVICGGVTTQNATVYLIDTVMMPPAMAEQG